MNGINKVKMCKSSERDEEKDDEDDLARPSTSRAGLMEEPQWNTSTRQLYEDNLKSSSCGSYNAGLQMCPDPQPGNRERLSSITDSTSSDDSCVYMYKGDDAQTNGTDVNKRVNCSSPEMDYLEMDFDPCQSNGQDSSDGSYTCDVAEFRDEEGAAGPVSDLDPVEFNEEERATPVGEAYQNSSPNLFSVENNPNSHLASMNVFLQELVIESNIHVPITDSNESNYQPENDDAPQSSHSIIEPHSSEAKFSNSSEAKFSTKTPEPDNEFQSSLDGMPSNDLAKNCTEHSVILKKHFLDGTSQCNPRFGYVPCCIATLSRAVNKLIGKENTVDDYHEEFNNVDVTITELLFKLSHGYMAIPNIQKMISGISDGTITTRFFQAHSAILLNLESWLHNWLKKDAVIVLCLNFHLSEKDCSSVANPSWHYHLVHNITPKGVQFFPQMDTVPEEILKKLFLNPSEVLIMKDYIMAHWTPTSNLKPLLNCRDSSWRQYNVLGQVVNVIRDTMTGKSDDEIRFIKVPSPHRTGILIMMQSDSVHLKDLLDADETFPTSQCI